MPAHSHGQVKRNSFLCSLCCPTQHLLRKRDGKHQKRGEENSRGPQVRRAGCSHRGAPLSLADNCCIWHFNGNGGRAGGEGDAGGSWENTHKETGVRKARRQKFCISFISAFSCFPPIIWQSGERGEFLLKLDRVLALLKTSLGWINFMGLTEQRGFFILFFFVCVFNEKKKRIYIK